MTTVESGIFNLIMQLESDNVNKLVATLENQLLTIISEKNLCYNLKGVGSNGLIR